MKICAAKPFFIKNAALMQLHKKQIPTCVIFPGRLMKFSEHCFASIIRLEFRNKNIVKAQLRKSLAVASQAFYHFM